jgi:DNA-binding transcriptional LysR family regulator
MVRNEIRFMEAVIALSEVLSFRRAAKILNISQPTLTRYINGAEKAAGVQLFERDHQTVKPLDSCWAYIEEARTALLHSRRCAQAAQAAHQNAEVVVHVGKSPYVDPFYITTLRTIQLPLHRNLRIEEFSQFSCDLAHEVLSGGVDVAIVTEPPESPYLSTVKIGESSFYIAMSQDDELVAQPSVTLDALAGRAWVLFERRLHPPVYDAVMQLAHERKVSPVKMHHVMIPEEAFPLISAGSCVAFVVKSGALRIARDGVTVRPLAEDALRLRTYLASQAENGSKVVSALTRSFMTKLSTFNKVHRNPLPVSA